MYILGLSHYYQRRRTLDVGSIWGGWVVHSWVGHTRARRAWLMRGNAVATHREAASYKLDLLYWPITVKTLLRWIFLPCWTFLSSAQPINFSVLACASRGSGFDLNLHNVLHRHRYACCGRYIMQYQRHALEKLFDSAELIFTIKSCDLSLLELQQYWWFELCNLTENACLIIRGMSDANQWRRGLMHCDVSAPQWFSSWLGKTKGRIQKIKMEI